ncbi:hypothetical protein [Pseudoduganella namucuonensis]|uniref:Periplasmic heavy metal sensor n=1 Tax=Pseudoduganella namucuonensis TaxID=1035707 RepID=A0A1I7GDF9_9BURK|nr:hypothetical protein [Pseudoduganella namucuonensis]SFU46453.1 hypothetical protein SAMN05216552_1003247 [Pseudoduganella namucuonensis]
MIAPVMLKRLRGAAFLLALAGAGAPVFATPVMDMRAEDLLVMAADFRKELNLNANQGTLWQQTESRTRALLRERQSRRERMQAASRAALDGKEVELRELAGGVEAEAAASAAEERQLREWWLTVNDALNETQRKQVAVFLAEQMQRVPDGGGRGGERPREGGEGHGGRKGGAGGHGGGQGGPARGG